MKYVFLATVRTIKPLQSCSTTKGGGGSREGGGSMNMLCGVWTRSRTRHPLLETIDEYKIGCITGGSSSVHKLY